MPRTSHLTDLRDKWVFVTGAASGIGLATARAFARRGARLFITDINVAALEACAQEIAATGATCVARFCDVADEASVAACAASFGRLATAPDVLVNNAGIAYLGGFMETPVDQWRRILQVNVMGAVLVTRAFLPAMRAAGGPRHVVNVASVAGFLATPNMSAYCASKGAAKLFSETLALELEGSRVNVHSVFPGVINTPIVTDLRQAGANIDSEQLAHLKHHYATRGCPPSVVGEDIVRAVLRRRAHVLSGPKARLADVVTRLSRRLTRAVSLRAARETGYLPRR